MKLFAVIFSVYILALAAMPCADLFVTENNHQEITITIANQNNSSDFDLCSPFCFCNCCQSLAEPNSPNLFNNITVFNKSLVNYQKQDYSNPIISIWNPPKI